MKPLHTTLLLLSLAAASPTALAHRTWLLPSATVVSGKSPTVSVDAAVSEDLFEFDTTALPLDGLSIVGPDGHTVPPDNLARTRRRSSFDWMPALPGTYRIVNTSDTMMASYQLGGETRRWRGSAQALAQEIPAGAEALRVTRMLGRVETWVTLERDGGQPYAPQGRGLELIPLTAPTDLSAGDTSQFRLLLDGQPAAGLDVTVLRGGNRYRYKLGELTLKTDAQGRFSVTWPEAGRYWIGASHGARGPGGTLAQPARRDSVSGSVEVLPR
ncbi:MAG: DUF4198 domain-containing protein [Rhizobacter sp.]|nr:DUF4198 domain-containing protein [Rhizobacter sp.]